MEGEEINSIMVASGSNELELDVKYSDKGTHKLETFKLGGPRVKIEMEKEVKA